VPVGQRENPWAGMPRLAPWRALPGAFALTEISAAGASGASGRKRSAAAGKQN
jgi:hypothetical protein